MTAQCSHVSGILFGRKQCLNPAILQCGQCQQPICKAHMVPQAQGAFLCRNCDARQNPQDDDDRATSRDRDTSSSTGGARTAAAAAAIVAGGGTVAGAGATGEWSDDDRAGFENRGGEGAVAEDTSDAADGDFDAS